MIQIDPQFVARGHAFRAKGWWRDRTLIHDFLDRAKVHPGKEAIAAYSLGAADPKRLSFGELRDVVGRIAQGLIRFGVLPGDVVACQLPNGWELVALTLATYRVGAVICPIVPILRAREVDFILSQTDARLVVTRKSFRNFEYLKMYRQLAEGLSKPLSVFVVDDDTDADTSFRHVFLKELADDAVLDARPLPDADDLAEVLFTSGTTGEPKGVLHTHNTEFARTRAFYEPLGLSPADTVFMSSTMGHSSGFLYGLCVPIMLGMRAVYLDIHDADAMLDIIERERATWSMGSTTFLIDAIAAQKKRPRDLSAFRLFASGGAPIPPQVVLDTRSILGARMAAIWGMTENGGVTATPADACWDAASRSDGHPVEWMELKVVDDSGADLSIGKTGLLKVRGASQTPGYLNRRELYLEQLDPEGWFDTGDLAYLDEEGNVRINGRTKDMIIRGGENIPVVEVEAGIFSMPEVREVAVVGYPDERLGERACAFVVLTDPGTRLTLRSVTDHLTRLGMSRTYLPERLVLLDQLPKTLSGKVQKFLLRHGA